MISKLSHHSLAIVILIVSWFTRSLSIYDLTSKYRPSEASSALKSTASADESDDDSDFEQNKLQIVLQNGNLERTRAK